MLLKYGVSDINSQLVIKGSNQQFQLTSQKNMSADALIFKAQLLAEKSPKSSELLAMEALRQNPTSGRAATHLLSLYEEQGRDNDADAIAELASKLWPAHSYTRSNLADYWLKRQRPDKLINEWNVLLTRQRSLGKALFPGLQKMVESEAMVSLVIPFAQEPPIWWSNFFAYLSRNLDVNRLRQLYHVRVGSVNPPTIREQNYYINRLIKERLWEEAYDVWFLGLSLKQMNHAGLIYDGGFESDAINRGFGWRFANSKNPKIKPDITYGMKGRRALQVTLREEKPIDFKHVWQRIMLAEGDYEFTVRYRADTLKSTMGLSWRLRCIEGSKDILAESEPILGSKPWASLKMVFQIPSFCTVQMVRLESVSPYKHDHLFAGTIWFDDIKIVKIQSKSGFSQ